MSNLSIDELHLLFDNLAIIFYGNNSNIHKWIDSYNYHLGYLPKKYLDDEQKLIEMNSYLSELVGDV